MSRPFNNPMWQEDESEPSDFDLLPPEDKNFYLREIVERGRLSHGSSIAPTRRPRVRSSNFQLLSTEELLQRPEPSWTVADLIPHDAFVLLIGRSRVGKTFLALDWAAHVSLGLPWFGRATQPTKVLYLALEGIDNSRIRAWMAHRHIDSLPDLEWITDGVNLKRGADQDALISKVQETKARLVILDTLNRSIAGFEENSSADMGVVIGFADRLRNEANAVFLVVHHSPREGNNPRGHSSLENAADTILSATINAKGTHILTVSKQRNAPDGATVKYRIAAHPSTGGAVIESVGPIHELDQLTGNERGLVQLLVQNPKVVPGPHATLQQAAVTHGGMAKSSFNAALKGLANKDILDRSSEGKGALYEWTAAGLQAIQAVRGREGPT